MKKLAVLTLGLVVAACGETPTQTPAMDAPPAALDVVLPSGSGVQKFTEDRDGVCGAICIGFGPVAAPIFRPGTELEIETGTWVTLTFGWASGWGTSEPTPEAVLQGALNAPSSTGLALSLGGEAISIDRGWRPETIQIFYDEFGDFFGTPQWVSQIRWVYYVKPQRKGSYVYLMNYQGGSWERTLTYVPDDAE